MANDVKREPKIAAEVKEQPEDRNLFDRLCSLSAGNQLQAKLLTQAAFLRRELGIDGQVGTDRFCFAET